MNKRVAELIFILKKIGLRQEVNQILKISAEESILNKLQNSERWDISEPNEGENRIYYTYKPRGLGDWKSGFNIMRDPDTGWQGKGREVFWDPSKSDVEIVEDKWGTSHKFKPKENYLESIPQNNNYMYRGMSWEEWKKIVQTGEIKSEGSYNLGDDQIGLTYFSSDATSASHYAHGFAPYYLQATPEKPAVVIAVGKREGKHVAGTAEHEIGVPGSININEIKEVWFGEPASISSVGSFDLIKDWNGLTSGSRAAPSIHIVWRKIDDKFTI
jgi:hypothetical protein